MKHSTNSRSATVVWLPSPIQLSEHSRVLVVGYSSPMTARDFHEWRRAA